MLVLFMIENDLQLNIIFLFLLGGVLLCNDVLRDRNVVDGVEMYLREFSLFPSYEFYRDVRMNALLVESDGFLLVDFGHFRQALSLNRSPLFFRYVVVRFLQCVST